MPGLVFDDGPVVDPAMTLGEAFAEWVDTTAVTRSVRTVSGYVADVSQVAAELLAVLGRPVPALAEDRDYLGTYPAFPAHLCRPDGPLLPVQVYARAHLLTGALHLADLHPRNLGRVMGRLGVDRAAASQRRLAAAMSSFCALLVDRGLLAENPMRSSQVRRPPAPKGLPRPLEMAEVASLLATVATPDERARAPWPARDLALASVFLATGVRLSEARTACVGDLSSASGRPRLRVLGKGSKARVVPVHAEAFAAVKAYLVEREARLGTPSGNDPLFVRADGTAFTVKALEHLVGRWLVRAGVRRYPGVRVHGLRHTYATAALDSGASVTEVQTMLGHESLETTSRYLQVVAEGLGAVADAHPTRALIRAVAAPGAAQGNRSASDPAQDYPAHDDPADAGTPERGVATSA